MLMKMRATFGQKDSVTKSGGTKLLDIIEAKPVFRHWGSSLNPIWTSRLSFVPATRLSFRSNAELFRFCSKNVISVKEAHFLGNVYG